MHRLYSIILVGAFISFGYSTPMVGQNETKTDLVTDRPDFTESAVVVPVGSFQFEGGFTWESATGSIRTFSGPELLVRLGLTRFLELRIGLPNYVDVRNATSTSGFGDGSLGAKIQHGPIGEWNVATVASLSLPTGETGFSSDGWDPSLILVAGRDLGERFSFGSQVFWESVSVLGDHESNWGSTLVLGTSLGSAATTGTFLELAATVPETGTTAVTIHHGYTHLLTKTLQVDIHGGVGLTDTASDIFFGAGMSIRR